MSVYDHMRKQDVAVFQQAARFYRVWILVRRTNSASVPYIGEPGYVPKRLDCKAKTADFDVTLPGLGEKKLAGLVVHPLLPGMEAAFKPGKSASVYKEWKKFEHLVHMPDPAKPRVYLPTDKPYTVQMDTAHKHYGCVMLSPYGLATNVKYIHGDYDLYAIVHESDPTKTERVVEERLGQLHARGREFFDIQHFLNRHMGVAMVLHGDQEKYAEHSDEPVDVFWPDGRFTEVHGRGELEELYRTTFGGRQTFHPGMLIPEAGKFHAGPRG